MGPGGRAERAVRRGKKIKIATGTTMASAARGKAMARRGDEWRTQSAVRSLHGLHVPSPLLSSDDDDSDEERKKIQPCFLALVSRDGAAARLFCAQCLLLITQDHRLEVSMI